MWPRRLSTQGEWLLDAWDATSDGLQSVQATLPPLPQVRLAVPETRQAVSSLVQALPPPPVALLARLPPGTTPGVVTLCAVALAAAGVVAGATAGGLAIARRRSTDAPAGGEAVASSSGGEASQQQQALVAAAAEQVSNVERRIRNVQSALGAMPAEWRTQRSPLEAKLRQLQDQLGSAVANLEAVKAGRRPPQGGLMQPRRPRRSLVTTAVRTVRAWFTRKTWGSLRSRARVVEDRLDALADALQAVQSRQVTGGVSAAAASGAGLAVRGDPLAVAAAKAWEGGDAAIEAQLSRLEGAIKQRWKTVAAIDLGDVDVPEGSVDGEDGGPRDPVSPSPADLLTAEAGALATLESRVEYLSAVLSKQPWTGSDVATRLAALDVANELHTDSTAALAVQLEETAAATRAAIEALTLRLAATEALAAALQQTAGTSKALPMGVDTLAPPSSPLARVEPALDVRGEKPPSRLDAGRDVILQGFNWTSHNHHGGASLYRRLRDRVADMAAVGFSAVWLPPCSQSLSPQGYMPQDYWNLDSQYGSEQELRGLLADMREAGLLPLADVVLNHRCATRKGRDGRWNRWDSGMRAGWEEWAITRNNSEWSGTGAFGTGEEWMGAPNLDHTNTRVRDDLKQFLTWLRHDVGFGGLRLDFVKGYAARFAREYVNHFAGDLAVGEMWTTLAYKPDGGGLEWNQDAHRQEIVNWIDATGGVCTAFDFTTKGILQEACAKREWWRLRDAAGRPPGVMGLWPSRAVSFLDNHDTGSTQGHWPFPSNRVAQGYAYILTHPATPCVLWDHAFEWGDDVRQAVRVITGARRAAGITSRSGVDIHKADDDCYAAVITGTSGALAVRLGGGSWAPPGGNWGHAHSGGHDGGHHCVWMRKA